MKLLFITPIAALALAGCVATPEQNTTVGALTGAAVGAAVSNKSDRVTGALAGAAVGAIAGTYLGKTNQPGKCYYRDANGNRFIANC
ncbi:glycine zipper domain-containing protein [Xinfangfangia sp. CPCC 101601]|uniref:Glycine zipper domain-containing protein n=1 Tax=Pseudogemmobacter lacusdianii TaxID=3069608 RepID=A0ABU0VUH4_9RHOB|nr:YMGG-like glycine zipper-containing protein [Xinfangfangia sp. CPCC 101601]MDQ2064915.1 glycine zipper domain-containing protein [Xinfangfangia sp. CPCC 101601]